MEYTIENFRFYAYVEFKRKKAPKEVYEALYEVFGDDAPGYSTVKRWISDFQKGARNSFADVSRIGRPVTASGDNNIEMIKEAINENPNLSVRDLEDETGITASTIQRILTHKLNYRKIASYWVPMNLNDLQKKNRVQAAQCIHDTLTQMGPYRYDYYVSEDETWVKFDIEHTSSSSKVWLPAGSLRPQIFSNKLTPKKCLLIIAFTANKRISAKALPYGETLNGEGYADFIHETGEKWRKLRTNPVTLESLTWQHDNARPHIKQCVQQLLKRRKVTMLKQAPYSPDLNLCDRWLNNAIKEDLRKEFFHEASDVEKRVLQLMRSIDEDFYRNEVDKLMNHCLKVVENGGEYITPS